MDNTERFQAGSARDRSGVDALTWRPSVRSSRLVVIAGLVIALLVWLAVVERIAYRGDVLPGVDVSGVNASGHSEGSVYADLSALAAEMETRELTARAGAIMLRANAQEARVVVDAAATIRAARRVGHSGNPVDAIAGMLLRRLRDDKVPLVVTYRKASLDALLARWQRDSSKGVRNADLQFNGTAVSVTPSRSGHGILVDRARPILAAALVDPRTPGPLVLPTGELRPAITERQAGQLAERARAVLTGRYSLVTDKATLIITPAQIASALSTVTVGSRLELTITADRLRAALGEPFRTITHPPVDASFRVNADNSVAVVPSRDGMEPDLRTVGAAIIAGQRRITARVAPVHPTHDTRWARHLGIKELVSSFTTHHPCCAARIINIHTAARLINNTVLEPGQVFSLNGIVGQRTAAKGFVKAPVYYDGFTEDFGGGVSQLSTTTFNAAWWGGFEIIQHQPHTIYFDRYPMGREATLNYPGIDLKWRNNSKHGVLVRTYFLPSINNSTQITVALYGDKEGKVVRETYGNCSVGPVADTADDPRCMNTISTTPVTTQIVECKDAKPKDDPTGECAKLKGGETKTIPGHFAVSVEFYREIKQPGHRTIRERYRWSYTMLPDVVLVGDPANGATSTTKPKTTPTTRKHGSTSTTGTSSTTVP